MSKPKLIITQITEVKNWSRPTQTIGFEIIPAEVCFDYKIQVSGNGNFDKYVDKKGRLCCDKIMMDIMEGKLDMVGKSKI